MNLKISAIFFSLILFATSNLFSQIFSYPGCSDVKASDFTKVDLVTTKTHSILEPIKMKIDIDGKIYWVERAGLVRVWNPSDNSAKTLLDVTSTLYYGGTDEHGLTGIALDVNFTTNKWIYTFGAYKSPQVFRVSRYTLNNDALGNEQKIIEIPYDNKGCCHTAGGMAFDFDGNLYIAIGNMTSNGSGISDRNPDIATNYVDSTYAIGDDQRGSANTNSLLGKIIKIKPKLLTGAAATDLGVGKTYDIPAGNLFPVGKFPADKTRPEIYTMGHRNPYSLNVEPYRNWITWGEVGPDEWPQSAGDTVLTEEHNLVTKPGFMGWPYFVGKNKRYRLNKDPLHPTNLSKNNTGLTDLPPAQAALHPYIHSAATSGPIYRYDGRLSSKTKLPPHFDKKWLVSDNNQEQGGYIDAITVNETGDSIKNISRLLPRDYTKEPLDIQIGPDGNLYILDYGDQWYTADAYTTISRIEYHGTACDAPTLYPGSVGIPGHKKLLGHNLNEVMLGFAGNMRVNIPEGIAGLQVFDIKGQMVLEKHELNKLGGWIDLQNQIKVGVYRVKFLP